MRHVPADDPRRFLGPTHYGWYATPTDRSPLDPGTDDDPRVPWGDAITFGWDAREGVPLWDDVGPLPEGGEWLQTRLGLSDNLIAALQAWGAAMRSLDGQGRADSQRGRLERSLRRQEEVLADRVRDELAGVYEVAHQTGRPRD